MAKPRYGKNEKIPKGTGAYKRAKKRAKKQGRTGLLQDGLTGREARQLRPDSFGGNGGGNGGGKPGVRGGVRKRALERLDYLEDHGGVPGGVRTRDGISRKEARKIRGAWQQERRHDPLTPRSGRDILRTSDALADLEYGPLENELKSQRQYEQGRQNVLFGPGGWFQQYQNQVAAAAQRQQVAEQAFQAGANAYLQNQQMGAQQGMTQMQGQAGTPQGQVDPDVQAQAQQAAQARIQMAQQAAVSMAARGASNVGAVNELAIAAAQQTQEGLMNSQARMQKVDQLARELATEKGHFRTAKIGELQEKERTYDLSRSAFGLEVAEAQEDARHNRRTEAQNRAALRAERRQNNREYKQWVAEFGAERADEMWDRMNEDRKFQQDVEEFGWKQATDRWDMKHGGKGGLSESERDKVAAARRFIRATGKKKGSGYVSGNKDTILDALILGKGVPPRLAKRALREYLKKNRRGPTGAGGGLGNKAKGLGD